MSRTFGRDVRLRRREEYAHVEQHGRRVNARFVTLVGCPNNLDRDRVGVIASRRVGSSVARNRAKRRLRALFRAEELDAARVLGRTPMDVVAIARRELVDAPFDALASDLRTALKRLRRAH